MKNNIQILKYLLIVICLIQYGEASYEKNVCYLQEYITQTKYFFIQKQKFKQENNNPMFAQKTGELLRYDEQQNKLRQKFLKPKSLDQIQQTSTNQIVTQFQVLSAAEIQEKSFNLQNNKMNRYIDIFAYEHSRVKIQHIPKYYINANQIRSLVDGNVFAIFSQAPVKKFDNFWEAVYYKHVSVVVMLCSFYDPKRGHQSEQYWPNHTDHATFSNGNLKVVNTQCNDNDKQYIVNTFQITGPQGVRKLTHIHWMGWSDLKKPVESNMQRFQQILEICLQQVEKKNLIWIHCSAGIGRTGTLGGVIEAIRYYKKHKSLSIFAIVENMRKWRYHAVQTLEQYRFLYQYLAKKLK